MTLTNGSHRSVEEWHRAGWLVNQRGRRRCANRQVGPARYEERRERETDWARLSGERKGVEEKPSWAERKKSRPG